jgi:hypothetical protein
LDPKSYILIRNTGRKTVKIVVKNAFGVIKDPKSTEAHCLLH